MRRNVAVINFTDVYLNEKFYKGMNPHIVNLDKLTEDKCLCSEDSFRKIEERLKDIPVDSLHFIDSGDYHYVSKAFAERIEDDFTLMVFDHHADMQEDDFKNCLTCGNWISHIHNPHLKNIILVGPLVKEKKIEDIPETEIEKKNFDDNKLLSSLPVYISIDKDILSSEIVNTNWDQGNMDEVTLLNKVNEVMKLDNVIGVDICGEVSIKNTNLNDLKQDDQLNREIEMDILNYSDRQKNNL